MIGEGAIIEDNTIIKEQDGIKLILMISILLTLMIQNIPSLILLLWLKLYP